MTRRIKEATKNLLWARAAGHCEHCGCDVTRDLFEKRSGKFGAIAHIKADAADGPRYDPAQSEEERNSFENLMLLCPLCHKLADDHPEDYPVERLLGIKARFEGRVLRAVSAMSPINADVMTLSVPIGDNASSIIEKEWRAALAEGGVSLVNERAFPLDPVLNGSFAMQMSQIEQKLEKFRKVIHNEGDGKTALFAVAPQPLLIGLGHILGDDDAVLVYQRDRRVGGWLWPSDDEPNSFSCTGTPDPVSEDCALVVSVSGEVDEASYVDAFSLPAVPTYILRAARQSSSAIHLHEDWDAFKQCAIDGIFRIHEENPEVRRLHVFPAMPLSANVAFGMAWNNRIIPEMVIYEKSGSVFKRALSIGGKDRFAD